MAQLVGNHLSKWIGKGNSGRSDIAANIRPFIGQDLDAKYPAKPAGGADRLSPKIGR